MNIESLKSQVLNLEDYSNALIDKYFTMFGEIPFILIGLSTDHPNYIVMLEYCIENKVKMTDKVINKFIKYEKGILY